jgi:predicted DNA-binding transcriptional regulator YafY
MAGEAGVTEKTIRRDLDLFRSVGFPLEEEAGEFGRKTWRMRREPTGPPLAFSTDEAAALFLCRRLLEPLAGTLLWEAVQNALSKVRATLSPLALDYLSTLDRVLFSTTSGAHDYSARGETIDLLQVSIEDRKCVRLLYRSERSVEASWREVHPYGLVQHRGALYLVALDPAMERVKHYKVDRIEDAEDCPTPFRMPPGFALEHHLAPSFAVYQREGQESHVIVNFAADVARYVEESKWHDSQALVRQPDGSLVADFRLSSTEEIKHWVLSFGPKAVVLGPKSLRDQIAAELGEMQRLYDETPSKNLAHAPARDADLGQPSKGD